MTEPRFLLDSNILIYILADHSSPVVRRIETMESGMVVTSAIAVAEAEVGFGQRQIRPAHFSALLQIIEPLDFDLEAARTYGRLPFRRHRFDHLIAAHALSRGLTLVTNNVKDFASIKELRVENWTLP